jgi:DNA-binding transcriptional ArsR family regulator
VDKERQMMGLESISKLDPSVLFNVIGEKSRLEILRLCLDHEVFTEELLQSTKLEKTLLSKHLRVLKDANILLSKKHGRRVSFQVNPKIKQEHLPSMISFHCCDILLKEKP